MFAFKESDGSDNESDIHSVKFKAEESKNEIGSAGIDSKIDNNVTNKIDDKNTMNTIPSGEKSKVIQPRKESSES